MKKCLIFLSSVLANSKLPVAEIFVLAGFILIYLVEEFGHWALVRWEYNKTFPSGPVTSLMRVMRMDTATTLQFQWRRVSKLLLVDSSSSSLFPSTTFLRALLWG